MKITIEVNGKPVEIELTKEQQAAIKRPADIKDRVKSYEDACTELNEPIVQLSNFSFLPENDREASFGFHQVTTIIRAFNEGWVADYNNQNQKKFYPYFQKVPSGFSFDDYDYDNSDTYVGARLVTKSSDLATHIGKNFGQYYNKFLN